VIGLELASDIEYAFMKHLLALIRAANDFTSEVLLGSSEDMLA